MFHEDTTNKTVIEWSIKNFSNCPVLHGERLECPGSTEGSLFRTSWELFIYPRGNPDSNPSYLGCTLKRGMDRVGPAKLFVELEFSLVTSEGIKTFAKSARAEFKRESCFEIPEFAKLEEIFKRKELLHDDTLKVRCEIRLLPRKKQISMMSMVSTIPTKTITRAMHLENFQETSKQNPMVLTINESSEKELCLNVSMNRGETSGDGMIAGGSRDDEFPESYLHMVMIKKKWDHPLHVNCCIKLLNKKSEIANQREQREFRHLFTEEKEKEEWVLPHFIDTNSLGDDCIDNGSLHLYFTFTISDKQPVLSGEVTTPWNLRDESKKCLMDDLVDMYQTRRFSDVTLSVGDENFKAHKHILAKRSLKFEEIFKNLMKEGDKCELVEIGDIDKDTMERMLKFIYTDELEDLDDEGSLLIYTAAQKYRISSLRCKCIEIFEKNLTLKTVYKVLVVAEEFKDSELKLLAQDYIEKHYGDVVLTPEWQAFTEEHKELHSEVVQYLRMKRQRELGE